MTDAQRQRMNQLERRIAVLEGRNPDEPAKDEWDAMLDNLEARIERAERKSGITQ